MKFRIGKRSGVRFQKSRSETKAIWLRQIMNHGWRAMAAARLSRNSEAA